MRSPALLWLSVAAVLSPVCVAQESSTLSLKKIVLYKHGVGFFEQRRSL